VVEIFIDPLNNGGSVFQMDDYRLMVNLNQVVLDSKGNYHDFAAWNGHDINTRVITGTLNQNTDTDNPTTGARTIGFTITDGDASNGDKCI